MFNGETQPVAHKSKNRSSLPGLNIRCISCHKDKMMFILDTLEKKPDNLAVTETWMAEDDEWETYNLKQYRPIETNPKKRTIGRSGGAPFILKQVSTMNC